MQIVDLTFGKTPSSCFQTSGKTPKFNLITKMPGEETADRNDPYGEMGFSSIKWYYGFMALRSERIAVYKVVAEL